MPETQVWVPPTTDITVVFPKTGARFYSDYYSPDLTDHRLSREDVGQFMKKIDNIRLNSEDAGKANHCTLYMPLAWLLEYVAKRFLCYLEVLDEKQATTFMLVAFFITSIIWCCFHSHFEQKQKDAIQKIVGEENEILKSKGLRWNLPSEFPAWIELCKDYKNQNYVNQSVISHVNLGDQDLEKQVQSQQNSGKKTNKPSQNKNYVPLSEDQDEN